MAVRAVRGAVQVDANERAAILEGTTELVTEVMSRNMENRQERLTRLERRRRLRSLASAICGLTPSIHKSQG